MGHPVGQQMEEQGRSLLSSSLGFSGSSVSWAVFLSPILEMVPSFFWGPSLWRLSVGLHQLWTFHKGYGSVPFPPLRSHVAPFMGNLSV
jgi:hypothetical protein